MPVQESTKQFVMLFTQEKVLMGEEKYKEVRQKWIEDEKVLQLLQGYLFLNFLKWLIFKIGFYLCEIW